MMHEHQPKKKKKKLSVFNDRQTNPFNTIGKKKIVVNTNIDYIPEGAT